MKENSRIVSERNLREQKIKEALTKKPTTPFLNKHGMTPTQIHQTFSRQPKRHPVTGKFTTVPKPVQPPPIGSDKPLKMMKMAASEPIKINSSMLSIEPVDDMSLSVEFPTPDWFRTTEKADVSVIIPLYKSNVVIIDLINSWTFEHQGLKVEAIFVDDCCPQNSKEAALRLWTKRGSSQPVGKIIHNVENKGYGASCNIGAQFATGDYLIFLNADTKLTPNWIEPMIRLMKKDPQVGMVGNLQIKEGGTWDGTIDSAGSEWSWEAMCFLHIGRHSYQGRSLPFPYTPEAAPPDILKTSEREMVTGCCFAVPAALWKEMGGFNPNYRVGYWEDAEICMAIRENGYKIMFQPDSKIYHKLSHTNSGSHPFHDHNRSYFMNKWVVSQRIDPLIDHKRGAIPDVNNILLKRRGANGDVLLAAAVAPALKAKYPNVKISFATDCPEVLEGNPYIDQVLPSVTNHNFQLYYNLDMAYEIRPVSNILTSYAEAVGVKPEACKLYLSTLSLQQSLPEKFVVIHPGRTAWVGRDWSIDKFRELANLLLADGMFVICIGKHSEDPIPCSLDLRGQLTISQLAYVMSKASFFAGIDSFPMHVAQTFDVPGACFFGSIDPQTRLVSKAMKAVVAVGLSCLGCHHRKPAPRVVTNVCETGTLDCISKVQVAAMYNMAKEALNG